MSRLAQIRVHLPKARRASWNLIDQGLSALTNVVLTFLVARNVSADAFGAFSVAFLMFSLAIGVERSLVGTTLSIRHSRAEGSERVSVMSRGVGTVLALALAASVVLAVVGALVGGDLGPTLVALAVVLPLLLAQDTCRMAFFAWARPQLATLNDFIWAVLQFSAVGVLIWAGAAPAWTLVLAWGLAAGVAALVGLIQLRALPHVGGVLPWIREHRDLVGYLFAEYLLGVGAFQGGILLIGGVIGVSNIGSLRAAQVLIGPIGIVATAGQTFGVPEVSRRASLPRHTMRIAALASAGLVLVTLLYAGLLLLIPDSVGVQLLGDTWTGASSVLLAVAVGSALAGGKLGPVIFIYGLGLARKTFRLVTTLAVLAVVGMVIGAYVGDAVGLAWGLAVAQGVVVPLWFLQLRRILRSPPEPVETA